MLVVKHPEPELVDKRKKSGLKPWARFFPMKSLLPLKVTLSKV